MKKLLIYLPLVFLSIGMYAQQSVSVAPEKKHKMAVFTPLYLDDAFNSAGEYRFSSKSFPKNSLTGLEFYHGVSMAIDSLNKLNIPLDVYVYDSKSARETIEQQFSKCAADGVELILANTSISELGLLARLAADKKITLINATVPNDANTVKNPYFVVINPTLNTQIEGLYQYLKKNYKDNQIIFFTHSGGNSEDYIKKGFEVLNSSSKTISLKYVEIGNSDAVSKAIEALDNTKPAIFVAGSLDGTFGNNVIIRAADETKNFPKVTALGMPTWENLNLSKPEFKDVEIIYGTPFYRSGNDVASRAISTAYNKKMFARPSDLVYRSYGLTYRFGSLLNQYGKDINKHLDDKGNRMFYDYHIQPVYLNGTLGYYENKKLYFLKYLNGSLQQVM